MSYSVQTSSLVFSDWEFLVLDVMELFIGTGFSDADHSTAGGFSSLGLLKLFSVDL